MGSRAAALLLTAAMLLTAALPGCAAPAPLPPATLAAFEAAMATRDSATLGLEEWCKARGIADPPRIVAEVDRADPTPEPDGLRQRLGVGADETLVHRHVRLRCGTRVLSVAHNWYVPARLTPAMNAALAASDIPFGKIAAPLGFRRERVETLHRYWPACPRDTVLAHRARLVLPDGRPLAWLIECYTPAVVSGR